MICDPVAYPFKAGVAKGGVITSCCAEDGARGSESLVDGEFRDSEPARDFLRRLAFKQQIEAGALLAGQPFPSATLFGG
jgi:hypothetical protein